MEWIKVQDRLPETGKPVLCVKTLNGKYTRQWVGFYTIAKDIEVVDDDGFDVDSEDNEEGIAYLKAGWYEEEETPNSNYDWTYLNRSPTHWMPLPEPPKP